MKKVFIALSLMFILLCSGCGHDPATQVPASGHEEPNITVIPEGTEEPTESGIIILATDCDSYGYFNFVCEKSGTYRFLHVQGDTAETQWQVYILDKEFTDAERYIPHAYEAALAEEGELDITEGQYVYVYCSANEWTAVDPVESDRMEVFFP